MKAKKKKLLIVFLVLIIGVLACLSVPAVRTLQAKYYLSQKYDAKMSEFKVEDYEGGHYTYVDALFIFNDYYWIDFSYEFSYNGRNFVVRKNDNGWYDDYQLEDLEKWSTEWLQANADSSIKGCYFDTKNLLNYYKINNIGYGNPIAQEDIKNFLLDYVKYDYIETIYYYIPENSDNYINECEMNKIISKSLGVNLDVHAQNKDNTLQREIHRGDEWTSHIGI